jgi:glycine/D-amino acid oxidase-like deaminating enzyme
VPRGGIKLSKKYDAIIIGAGVIGAAVAFELAKKGYRTLNVDKLASAGYGSTSGSCAIIRLHYSTPDGVAMAREGYYYWLNWVEHLGVEDELGLVKYINTGCLVTKTAHNKYLKNVMASLDDLGVAYEELDTDGIDYQKDGTLISDGDIGCYSRPETGNHILVGSEDPECDKREWVDPDEYNRNFTDQWLAQALREAQRIEGLRVPNQRQGVVDLYDVSDDWIPIYDKSDLPGFYMAVGTSGNQYKNVPVVGVMMAELIEKVEVGHDHDKDPNEHVCRFQSDSSSPGHPEFFCSWRISVTGLSGF